ncbi:hypothetical protein [Nocardia sp. NPDC057353]|uniref:LppU family putative lipoprotein n=1 Tax=Nocardia sp. NPDC057353 TaxID=3346104 RepID=UPI003636FA64
MSRLVVRRALTATLGAVAALTLIGCSSTVTGTAQPEIGNGTIDAVSTTSTPKPSGSKPSSGKPTPSNSNNGGDIDFDAAIGDCVTLGGTINDATIAKASCGSRASNYKVIGKAPTSTACVGDRDNYYAETLNNVETGALCLDIDWVVGGCMDVGGDDPKRIDCTESAIEGIRVVNIVQGTDDVGACDTSSGFKYSERRFVVCVEDL